MLTGAWRNAVIPADVDNSGLVTIADALQVVAHLRDHGSPSEPPASPSPEFSPSFLDVDGDELISVNDLVEVISELRNGMGLPRPAFAAELVEDESIETEGENGSGVIIRGGITEGLTDKTRIAARTDDGPIFLVTPDANGAFTFDAVQTIDSELRDGAHTTTIFVQNAGGFFAQVTVSFTRQGESLIFSQVEPIATIAGQPVTTQLAAVSPKQRPVTFSVVSEGNLPPYTLDGDGVLTFTPGLQDAGEYTFAVVADDGELQATQEGTLTVEAEPLEPTRIVGWVVNAELEPLAGIRVELGGVSAWTAEDGSFELTWGEGPLTFDELIVHGHEYAGPQTYESRTASLEELLENGVIENAENTIDAPIVLIATDSPDGGNGAGEEPAPLLLAAVPPLTIEVGLPLTVQLAAVSPEGRPVSFTLLFDSELPLYHLEADGRLTFEPDPGDVGQYSFTVVADDGVLQATQEVTLTVEPSTPPAPPSAPRLAPGWVITGTAEPRSTVSLYYDGNVIASGTTDDEGIYAINASGLAHQNWILTATATDSVGNTSALSEKLVLLNVKAYGAVGDGVTDDTDAIQAALDDAGERGGATVFLPDGVYGIGNPLLVPSHTRFLGNGAGNSVLQGKLTGYGGKIVNGAEVYATVALVAVENSSVESLTVDHRTNGTHANGIVILPDGVKYSGTISTDCTIQNTEILGFDRHEYLIWSVNGARINILNNYLDGGVEYDQLPSSNQEGIEIFGGTDVLVQGNTIERLNFGITAGSLPGFEAHRVQILDNTVRWVNYGVAVGGNNFPVFPDDPPPTGTVEASDILVQGNSMHHTYTAGFSTGSVSANIVLRNFNITGNTIAHSPIGMRFFHSATLTPADITVDHFHVSENEISDTTGYAAIAIHFVHGVHFHNNVIRNSAGEGFRLSDSSEIVIAGNEIENVGKNAINVHRSWRIAVEDNRFTNYAQELLTPGVLFTSGADSRINRNQFMILPEREVFAVVIDSDSAAVEMFDNELLYEPRFANPLMNLGE